MAQKNKRGLVDKIFMGSEKSEGYARASLPSSRWELFWDIFKGRFWKIMLLNLLLIIFFAPVIALLIFRAVMISGFGAIYPFAQGFGTGYGGVVSLVGLAEQVVLNVEMLIYLLSPIAFCIAAVGVAGGAYIARNMIWTEGIFVANDFWRGIKQNAKQMITVAFIYSLVFYFCSISIAFCNKFIVAGEGVTWLFTISKVALYIFLIFYSMMTLHMITMSVTYELRLVELIKNSFLFTLAFIPHNVIFFALGLLPFILFMLGSILQAIGIVLMILFGFSLILLVWTNFSQWIYDKHVNDHVKGAKKYKGIYDKVETTNSKALQQYKQQVDMQLRSALTEKPIKPITDEELQVAELPATFNRRDLQKLQESKEAIYEDHRKYVEEHMSDPQYQPTEAEKEQQRLAEERQKRIEKAKKALSKRKK